jgi:ribosomal protein RSM22 (predicted rRNA methylase)
MELPPALRQAVDQALHGVALADLKRAADVLSRRYRGEVRDGRLHLSDRLAAQAYLATRLPATYAAIRASLAAISEVRPDFAPKTLLDVGAGPGSVLWAARDCWESLDEATLVETSDAIRKVGADVSANAAPTRISWVPGDVETGLPSLPPADIVTLAYVLDELPPPLIGRVTDQLWALTSDTLVIVEPGTPAGWQRILQVRERLLAARIRRIALSSRPTGVISRAASPALACIASQRTPKCPGKTRNTFSSPPREPLVKVPPPACWRRRRRRAARSG